MFNELLIDKRKAKKSENKVRERKKYRKLYKWGVIDRGEEKTRKKKGNVDMKRERERGMKRDRQTKIDY